MNILVKFNQHILGEIGEGFIFVSGGKNSSLRAKDSSDRGYLLTYEVVFPCPRKAVIKSHVGKKFPLPVGFDILPRFVSTLISNLISTL